MEYISYALYLVLAVGGFFIGYTYYKKASTSKVNNAAEKAEKLISDAKLKEKELLLKAQDKALNIIDESKKEEASRRNEINQLQKRLEISGLSQEAAKEILIKKIEVNASEDLLVRINKLENYSEETINEKAKDMMALAMQRMVSNYTVELTTTTVDLPSDEMKGRIIGREGRNIKAIETMTGVEIIVDDTPNAITVSGFSLIRRHIAKKTLDYLIKDGRIHPTKIEEAVENAKKDIALDIKKAGEEAMYEVGVTGFDPKLFKIPH